MSKTWILTLIDILIVDYVSPRLWNSLSIGHEKNVCEDENVCEDSGSHHLASLVMCETVQLSIVETVNKDEVSVLKWLKKKKKQMALSHLQRSLESDTQKDGVVLWWWLCVLQSGDCSESNSTQTIHTTFQLPSIGLKPKTCINYVIF